MDPSTSVGLLHQQNTPVAACTIRSVTIAAAAVDPGILTTDLLSSPTLVRLSGTCALLRDYALMRLCNRFAAEVEAMRILIISLFAKYDGFEVLTSHQVS